MLGRQIDRAGGEVDDEGNDAGHEEQDESESIEQHDTRIKPAGPGWPTRSG